MSALKTTKSFEPQSDASGVRSHKAETCGRTAVPQHSLINRATCAARFRLRRLCLYFFFKLTTCCLDYLQLSTGASLTAFRQGSARPLFVQGSSAYFIILLSLRIFPSRCFAVAMPFFGFLPGGPEMQTQQRSFQVQL